MLSGPATRPKAWEFQPGIDTDDSFAVFSYWLVLPPPRDLRIAARACQRTPQQVSRWANADLWRERAQEYDKLLNDSRRAELEKLYKQDGAAVALEWLEPITTAKGFIKEQLEKFQIEGSDREGVRIKPNELSRLFQVVFQAERLLRGQATEITSDELDLSKLTDEELAEYDRMVRKARKEGI